MTSSHVQTLTKIDGAVAAEIPAKSATISVVIPVRNEEHHIERTLHDLLVQDRTGLVVEILVVDGRSDDETRQIVQRIAARHPEVQLHDNPRRLSSAARNIGIRASTGDFVLIVDGHCQISDPQHLRKVVDAFVTTGADCLGRPQPLDVSRATSLQRAIAVARSSRLGHHPESFIYSSEPQFVPAKSVAVAYRRSVFDKVGHFDERFDAHEDGELNYRIDQAGLRCYFSPDLAVKYVPRNSLSALYRQMVRYGKGRVRFSGKHSGTWGWGTLVPALFVLHISLGSIPACVAPAMGLLYLGGVLAYSCVVLAFSLGLAVQSRDLTVLPWLPLVYATVHIGSGVGILTEAILHRQRAQPSANPGTAPRIPKAAAR